jgi:hypothetical protein
MIFVMVFLKFQYTMVGEVMSRPALIVPTMRESPLLEELQLGGNVASLAKAQECMEWLARDHLGTVVDQTLERIESIDAHRDAPVRTGVPGPDMLAELARLSHTKQTHFRYLLAEGAGYVLHANVYGVTPEDGTEYAGYYGSGTGRHVEFEHTHNRHFVAMRICGASYLAHERRTPEPTDNIITEPCNNQWVEHRASLCPQDVEYGTGSVYSMDADSVHALTLGGFSISVLVELREVRDFSTSFYPDGTVRAHHETGMRKFNRLSAKLAQPQREHGTI